MMNRIKLTAVITAMALALAACGVAQGSHDGSIEPDVQYRPIEPEGDVAGDGTLLRDGQLLAVDGTNITIGFWMGVEDCYAVEFAQVEETKDVVKVDISVAARDVDAACIEIAEARSVTLELEAPLGERTIQIGDVSLGG